MFGYRVTLFRLMGFAVRADASWIIIVVLVTWSLATGVFPQLHKGLTAREYWLMGLAGALVLFLSVVVHELAHSIVARRFGIPMKGITLFVFGGVAEMDEEPPSPKAELLMAIAGPVTSVVIGVLLVGVAVAGLILRWPTALVAVIQYVGFINVMLAAFNMLPAFPLDGGRVLRSIVWWRKGNVRVATRIASRTGSALGFALILLGFYALFTGNALGGVWWVLIGMFVRNAAAAAYQQVVIREALQGQPVSRFMNREPVTVPRSISVAELVNDYTYRYHYKMFPVVDGEQLVGCVTTREIKQLSRDEWEQQTVGAIAQTCDSRNSVSPSTDAMQALAKMAKSGQSRLMVVEGDRLVGVIALKDMMRYLALKIELEDYEES